MKTGKAVTKEVKTSNAGKVMSISTTGEGIGVVHVMTWKMSMRCKSVLEIAYSHNGDQVEDYEELGWYHS